MPQRLEGTIVFLAGHHSTYVSGLNPSEVEYIVSKGRQGELPFVYLHESGAEEGDGCANRVAVDPTAVVALIADIRSTP